MGAVRVKKDDEYILNHCTKHLARANADARHSFFGMFDGQERGRISESWRFPIIDSHDSAATDAYDYNDVTFVYCSPQTAQINLVTSCHRLYEPLSLQRVGDSVYWACSLRVPKGERHRYLFDIDGRLLLDPINPQTQILASGEQWSSFFTWGYNQPVSFERWEFTILDRLTRHVLPFKTQEAENFLKRGANQGDSKHLYRLYTSVGVSNFIDNLVSREERQHRYAYETCLEMIDVILRRRYPGKEPAFLESAAYERLYNEMADDGAGSNLFVDGWDRTRYGSPFHFVYLLRRHAITGAFSHPKYGGNAGAMAWAYLAERYREQSGKTAFDWRAAIEPPLGSSSEYRG